MRDRDPRVPDELRDAVHRFGWAALLAIAVVGCATVPATERGAASPLPDRAARPATPQATPAPTPAPGSPMPGTAVGTTASGGTILTTGSSAVVLDTFPSRDASAVLESIPEPLPSGQRVPPPRLPAGHPAASPAVPDTVAAESEEEAADVPIPSPTRVLGDRPRPAPADSGAAPASGPAASPAPAAPPAPARPDTCWRVQVAAVPERERAEALKSAAQSQLLVEWVIETDGKLHKVRTKGCHGALGADGLRKRAVGAGFAGAFRFQNSTR